MSVGSILTSYGHTRRGSDSEYEALLIPAGDDTMEEMWVASNSSISGWMAFI